MKAKTRLLWMKLHAYFSCFFLPLTLVYILSGVLYLFGIKGEVKQEFHYPVSVASWPSDQGEAAKIITPILTEKGHFRLPADYFASGEDHSWYGYKHEIIFAQVDDKETHGDAAIQVPNPAQLTVKEHDFWLQLLIIHKGYAGYLFWLLAIALGASLTFSLVSGVIISLQMPQLKKNSLWMLAFGSASLIGLFMIG